MVFNSFEFLLFFPIVTLLYFIIPHKFRWLLLLLASCFFYAFFKWEYLFILVFTIIIDYYAGIWIGRSEGKQRKIALAVSLVANVGVLALFKYYYFILGTVNSISFRLFNVTYDPIWDILLPIGLSFHTFQAMSYTIEVYRKEQAPETNFGIYALYVMFYPQLVAGPIERPQNILHQFKEVKTFDTVRITSGLRLMLWGFFKKVAIADNVAVYSDMVFGEIGHYQGFALVLGAVFYTIQIYCDFSGYSDIAIGSARVMGFNLMKNFNRPYAARNIADFWRRWHISLSTWFKDYVYIPLGGNRVKVSRKYINLMIVFLLSGLWHGPSWNFVIWGGIHGVYQIFGMITRDFQTKLFGSLGKLGAILENAFTVILVMIAWVFFRAESFADTKYFFTHIFEKSSHTLSELVVKISWDKVLGISVAMLILELVQYYHEKYNLVERFNALPKFTRWGIYYFFIYFIIVFGYFGSNQFIYFQF